MKVAVYETVRRIEKAAAVLVAHQRAYLSLDADGASLLGKATLQRWQEKQPNGAMTSQDRRTRPSGGQGPSLIGI